MDQPTRPTELTEQERADQVESLAGFLTAAPLPNDTTADIPAEVAHMLADTIIHWQHGEIFHHGRWQPLGEVTTDPDVGDVRAEKIADGAVLKLTHTPTGLTALGESGDQAWTELRRKVADHGSTTVTR